MRKVGPQDVDAFLIASQTCEQFRTFTRIFAALRHDAQELPPGRNGIFVSPGVLRCMGCQFQLQRGLFRIPFGCGQAGQYHR